MKSKLIPLLTTLVLTLGSQTLLAQPGPGGGGGGGGMGMGNPEARVTELIATLEITSQQEAAFREAMGKINEMQMSAMREMMGNGGGGMRMGAGQGAMPQGGQGAMPQSGQAAAPADAPVDHSQHGGAPATGDQAAAAGDHASHGAAATTDAPAAAGGGMRMGSGQGGGMAMNMERRAEMQRQAEALLTPVLTAAQMAKYRDAEEARMTQMRERMMQRGQ
jgi:hypothetical protein